MSGTTEAFSRVKIDALALAPRGDRLHAVPLAQGLRRYPRLKLRREPSVSSWPSRCLLFRLGIHPNDLSPKNGTTSALRVAEGWVSDEVVPVLISASTTSDPA